MRSSRRRGRGKRGRRPRPSPSPTGPCPPPPTSSTCTDTPTRITGTPTSMNIPRSFTSTSTTTGAPRKERNGEERVDHPEIRANEGDPRGRDLPQRLPVGRPSPHPSSRRAHPDPPEDLAPRRVPPPPDGRPSLGL